MQAESAQRGRAGGVEGIEAQGAVVASAERAADGEVGLRHVQDLRQRVDIIGAARKPAGRIDRQRLRVGVAELEGIAFVRIAVAEGDDIVDVLRGGRTGDRAGGECSGAQQGAANQSAIRHESLSPRPERRPPTPRLCSWITGLFKWRGCNSRFRNVRPRPRLGTSRVQVVLPMDSGAVHFELLEEMRV